TRATSLGPHGCPTRRASGRRALQTRGPESGFAPVHEPPLVSPLPDGGLGAAETEEEAGAPDVHGIGGARLHLVSRPSSHRGERLIVRPVLIGGFFTFAGLVTVMTPSFPFICIGALIFGAVDLLRGLFGNCLCVGAP